jgi:two-component system, response regulator
VVVARDGEEALDYLFAEGRYAERDAGAVPRLVLLELKLAKVDGFQFLERLRTDERTRLLPVAVFASSDEEQDLLESHGLGADIYIRKPLNFVELSEVGRRVGLYWLVLDGA